MKIKLSPPSDVRPNLSKYFIDSIYGYYIERGNGVLLGWLYFDQGDYFLIKIKDCVDEYIECTPLIMIHRHPETNPFYFEEDRGPEDLLKYPWIIKSKGCDDGSKGWRFETKEQLDEWFQLLCMEINELEVQHSMEHVCEFWEYFSENQVWVN